MLEQTVTVLDALIVVAAVFVAAGSVWLLSVGLSCLFRRERQILDLESGDRRDPGSTATTGGALATRR